MRAMVLPRLVSLSDVQAPLELADLTIPELQYREVLIRVAACGVCQTEFDEIEGRTAPPKLPVVLGHEVVGHVEKIGDGVSMIACGDRVGVGWTHSSSGEADENVSPLFQATGRDAFPDSCVLPQE